MRDSSEAVRLATLQACDILDTPADPGFDRLAGLAARVLGTPMAVVAFADADRHWFKARCGVGGSEMPRARSFCDVTISGRAVFVVADALQDDRFRAAPVVTGPPFVRFYAGAPLVTPEGNAIGSLCVLDTAPRAGFGPEQAAILTDLAAHVMELVEARQRQAALSRRTGQLQRSARLLRQISDSPTWQQALDALLVEVCASCGAVAGSVWRLAPEEDRVLFVAAHACDPRADWYLDHCRTAVVTIDGSLLGQVMARMQPRQVLVNDPGVPASAMPRAATLAAHGIATLVYRPLQVAGTRFVLVLAFESARACLAEVDADLQALEENLRPALYRKVAENRLFLLGTALDASQDGVLILESEGSDPFDARIVYASAEFLRGTGFELSDLIGQPARMLYGESPLPVAEAATWAALREHRSTRVELETRHKDGSRHWIELSVTPVPDEAGRSHLICLRRDITERRNAEDALREREASFRLLFEANPVAMWLYDPVTLGFLEANMAARERYGWTRKEFLRRSLFDVRPSDEASRLRAEITAAPENFSQFGPVTHRLGDGRLVQVMIARHRVEFEGRPAQLAAIWDITELENARAGLRANQDRLERLASELSLRGEELDEAMAIARLGRWHWQPDSDAVTWSAELYRIAGRDPADPVGNLATVLTHIHPEDRGGLAARLRAAALEGNTAEYECRFLRPDGTERHLWGNARPLWGEDGSVIGMRGVAQDITERKHAETALLHAEKLRSLGQLTGGIAHDFNNLLMVVLASLEEAMATPGLARQARELLKEAMQATMRGRELTGRLLAYARRQPLKPEVTRVDALLGGFVPLLRRALGARHELRLQPVPAELRCRVDPGQLEQAMMNLAINARDAMPDGGVIEVSARACASPGQEAQLPPGDYVALEVRDSGIGMSPELLGRAFEPFFTTKPVGEGSGLGLSMVYGFAKQSGGHLAMASTPGQGTCATLILPAVAEAAADPPPPRPRREQPFSGRSVLLVEDKVALQQVTARLLEGLGFVVSTAAAAGQALQALGGDGRFDLLLSDVVLPGGMDGLGLAAAARARSPGLRVLLTSGYTEHAVAGRLGHGSDFPLLMKPFRRAELVARLHEVFARA